MPPRKTSCQTYEITKTFSVNQLQEKWRRKGIGSEWIGVMKEFVKSQRAERFYAANVQTESEGFFDKVSFVRTDDPDWWIVKEF